MHANNLLVLGFACIASAIPEDAAQHQPDFFHSKVTVTSDAHLPTHIVTKRTDENRWTKSAIVTYTGETVTINVMSNILEDPQSYIDRVHAQKPHSHPKRGEVYTTLQKTTWAASALDSKSKRTAGTEAWPG